MKTFIKKGIIIILMIMFVQMLFPLTSQAASWDESRWMEHKYNALKSKPLNKIALPGTHDSATYYLDKNSWDQIDNGFADFIQLEKWPIIKDIIYNYSRTQHISVYDQLVEGNRYLDLRFKRDGFGAIRAYHGMYGVSFDTVLNDITRFALARPKEIIIVDLQNLHNLNAQNIDYIHSRISSKLGHVLADRNVLNPTSTYKSFIDRSTNVIILTNNSRLYSKGNGYWSRGSSIISNWKNTSDINILLEHLINDLFNNKDSKNYKFYVSQMVLSPNGNEITDKIKDAAKYLPIPIYGPIRFSNTLKDIASTSLLTMITPHQQTLNNFVSFWSEGVLNITMRDFYDYNHIRKTIDKNK